MNSKIMDIMLEYLKQRIKKLIFYLSILIIFIYAKWLLSVFTLFEYYKRYHSQNVVGSRENCTFENVICKYSLLFF